MTSTLTNSRHAAQSSKHPAGIGLENVRKRLELIYGAKNYSLEIREEEKTYTVKLGNPDAQCLNVSPSTTSRWLCVS